MSVRITEQTSSNPLMLDGFLGLSSFFRLSFFGQTIARPQGLRSSRSSPCVTLLQYKSCEVRKGPSVSKPDGKRVLKLSARPFTPDVPGDNVGHVSNVPD